MLKIQRASAGSGKTYALARSFILFLIARKVGDNWVLRNQRQTEDALKHIMAITFTNKATNEMQQRIIKNLSMLAKAAHLKAHPDLKVEDIPYLDDFKKLTKQPIEKIGEAAQFALKSILNNYSVFKISTIDSFFQELLRTFVFEAELNDTYQVEIDATYVADAALDTAIHKLDSAPETMGNASFWITEILGKEAKKSQPWNSFNNRASKKSIFYNIREALLKLQKEDFKEIKDTLYSFYDKEENFNHLKDYYNGLKEKGEKERKTLYDEIMSIASSLSYRIASNSDYENQLNKNFIKNVKKVENLEYNELFGGKSESFLNKGTVFNTKYAGTDPALDEEAMEMYKKLSEWDNPKPDSYYRGWRVYGDLIPYLGLILEVRHFLTGVLEANNLIQLSETSFILKKIIGDDDAPFVYERLGDKIQSFLIDEFQDTSIMQWDIIKPLLTETEAKESSSLIIGDPKQSIYRFRNACHYLISEIVPAAFPEHIPAGFSVEENTNWRSNTRIIEFNNYLFKGLAEEINTMSKEKGNSTNFLDLYKNVVQYPNNREGKGYVEVRMFPEPEKKDKDAEKNVDEEENGQKWFVKKSLEELPVLVSSLIKRGYNQKDIAVLVDTNEQGKGVVESFILYNEKAPEDSPKIDFISDESLLISSSPAVEIIIDVFRLISSPKFLAFSNTDGEDQNENDSKDSKKSKYINWESIKLQYNLFSLKKPGLSPAESMMTFLKQPETVYSLYALFDNARLPSLSALVEMIIATFITEEMRDSEALYLSSFQDAVNEYSASHVNDPVSFLEWWKIKGSLMSVASPEGIDAVQIMTIHKSKGLEFKCVIVPFAVSNMVPTYHHKEWRWVRPVELDGLSQPPVLPVHTLSTLKGSIHEPIYREYYDQILTDVINKYYVAFTRAKNELYIFTQQPKKNMSYIYNKIETVLRKDKDNDYNFTPEERRSVMNKENLEISETGDLFTYGKKFTSEEIEEENRKDAEKKETQKHYFEGYYINQKRPRLRASASMMNPSDSL